MSPNLIVIQDLIYLYIQKNKIFNSITFMEGWNRDKVEEVLEVTADIYDVDYELQNCVRGGSTGCYTYAELGAHLQELGERLIEAGRSVACEDEDPEDEEEN